MPLHTLPSLPQVCNRCNTGKFMFRAVKLFYAWWSRLSETPRSAAQCFTQPGISLKRMMNLRGVKWGGGWKIWLAPFFRNNLEACVTLSKNICFLFLQFVPLLPPAPRWACPRCPPPSCGRASPWGWSARFVTPNRPLHPRSGTARSSIHQGGDFKKKLNREDSCSWTLTTTWSRTLSPEENSNRDLRCMTPFDIPTESSASAQLSWSRTARLCCWATTGSSLTWPEGTTTSSSMASRCSKINNPLLFSLNTTWFLCTNSYRNDGTELAILC